MTHSILMEVKIKEIRLGKDGKLYVHFKHDLAETVGMLRFNIDHQEYLKEQWGDQPWNPIPAKGRGRKKRKYGKR